MNDQGEQGRYAYEGLDRTIHEKARLSILASLMKHPEGLSFAELKTLCGLTDGNLSRHMGVLRDAGLVEIEKGYEGNRPHTRCFITRDGQAQFLDYVSVLEQVVRDAAAQEKSQTAARSALKQGGKSRLRPA